MRTARDPVERARAAEQYANDLDARAKSRSELQEAVDAWSIAADAWEEAGNTSRAEAASFQSTLARLSADRTRYTLDEAISIARRRGWLNADYYLLPSSEMVQLSMLRLSTKWRQGAASVASGHSATYAFHRALAREGRRRHGGAK